MRGLALIPAYRPIDKTLRMHACMHTMHGKIMQAAVRVYSYVVFATYSIVKRKASAHPFNLRVTYARCAIAVRIGEEHACMYGCEEKIEAGHVLQLAPGRGRHMCTQQKADDQRAHSPPSWHEPCSHRKANKKRGSAQKTTPTLTIEIEPRRAAAIGAAQR